MPILASQPFIYSLTVVDGFITVFL